MTDLMDGWRSFLVRWSQEWADAQDPRTSERASRGGRGALRTRWLGFPPASEERIRAWRSGSGTAAALVPDVSGGERRLAARGRLRLAAGRYRRGAGTRTRRAWPSTFPGIRIHDLTPEDVLLAGMRAAGRCSWTWSRTPGHASLTATSVELVRDCDVGGEFANGSSALMEGCTASFTAEVELLSSRR